MAYDTNRTNVSLSQIGVRAPDTSPAIGSIIFVPAAGGGWQELAITVPAANVRNALAVDNAETAPSWKVTLDATNPANIAAAASPGTSLIYSHRDHVHALVAGVISHASLTNLTAPADDHTQYALLAGRSGGQTLIGGTASGDVLTLQGSSHANGGQITANNDAISTASANVRGLISSPEFTGSGANPSGIESQPKFTPSASITDATGIINLAIANPGTGVTITNLFGGFYRTDYRSVAGAVTNGYGAFVASPSIDGTLKPTNQTGLFVGNQGAASITLAIGVDIGTQSGATTNYGLRSAAVLVPSTDEGVNLGTTALRWGTMYGMVGTKYKARAQRNTDFTLTDNVATKIQWATEDYDPNNNFDSTTNYNYTAPKTGYYKVSSTASISSPNALVDALTAAYLTIFVNGAEKSRGNQLNVATATLAVAGLEVNDILSLTANDTVDIRAFTTSATAAASKINGGATLNHFAIHLISVD